MEISFFYVIFVAEKDNKHIMVRFGHCKNCWWWNRVAKNKGICWFQTYYEDNPHYTYIDAYCPDYTNRLKANKENKQTLKEWLEEQNFKFITYK